MAFEQTQVLYSAPAAADQSAKQFYAAQIDTNGKIALATAAKSIDGVLQGKSVAGQASVIAMSGISKVAITALTAVNTGDLLEVDTDGTFKPHAAGIIVAKALETLTSNAAVCLITAKLLPSNGVYS